MKKLSTLLLHLVMLAIVCAAATYWILRIVTPPSIAAPPPVAAPTPREADPALAARMFGLVQAAPVVVSNVQLVGVFSAGKHSSAVLAVDGRPARVVLLGRAVSGGSRLVDVRPDGVTLDNNGARQELSLPLRAPVALGGLPPPAGFTRDSGTLTAPSAGGPAIPATGLPAPAPSFPAPGFPGPGTPLRPMQPMQPPFQPQTESLSPQNPSGTQSSLSQ